MDKAKMSVFSGFGRVCAAMAAVVVSIMAGLSPLSAMARAFANEPSGAAATVPDAITPYERRVLRLEYQKLVREIAEMRRFARDSAPELDAERKALADALDRGDAPAAEKARKALDAAVEEFLRHSPESAAKIKRLGDVGMLLTKDTPVRKELRSLQHERPANGASEP